jgi:hypothetical protein
MLSATFDSTSLFDGPENGPEDYAKETRWNTEIVLYLRRKQAKILFRDGDTTEVTLPGCTRIFPTVEDAEEFVNIGIDTIQSRRSGDLIITLTPGRTNRLVGAVCTSAKATITGVCATVDYHFTGEKFIQ